MARRQRPARRARPAMRAGRYRAPSATQRPRQPDRVPRVAAKTFAQIPPVAVPRIAHGSTPREGRRRLYYPQLERVPPATVGLPVPRGSPGASSRGHDCAGSSVADELKEIQEASRSRRKTVRRSEPTATVTRLVEECPKPASIPGEVEHLALLRKPFASQRSALLGAHGNTSRSTPHKPDGRPRTQLS